MDGMPVLHLILIVLISLEWKFSILAPAPTIKLELTDSCRSEAQFEWLILDEYEHEDGRVNCTFLYSTTAGFSLNNSEYLERRPVLRNSDILVIKSLVVGQDYSAQIICRKAVSDILLFRIEDKDCSSIDNPGTTSETPVVFKEETSLLGTRDSVLGIVFALFGLLIIIVTTFYIVRKIRRRQRLERIRRYLGSSLIDPFENMQDREQGSERLIQSTDS